MYISKTQAKWILKGYVASRIFWSRKIQLWDEGYRLVDERKLNVKPVSLPTGADCEDKAYCMLADIIRLNEESWQWLCGIAEGKNRHGEEHAWIFYVPEQDLSARDGIIKYVEPATAEIFTPVSERVQYFHR